MGERQPAQLPNLPANIFTALMQTSRGRTQVAPFEDGVRTRAAINLDPNHTSADIFFDASFYNLSLKNDRKKLENYQ